MIHIASITQESLPLALGIIMIAGSLFGKGAQLLHSPQVVGYFVCGLILGVSGFKVLTAPAIASLAPVNTIALALIGFLVGGELKAAVIKKYGKCFTSVLMFEALTPAILVGFCTALVSYLFTRNAPLSVSFGLLLGAICSSTAPAATTDVLQEYRSRGPLTTMVYGVVAMDDAVALILFAIASTLAAPLIGGHPAPLSVQLLLVLKSVMGSILFAILPGILVILITKKMMEEEGRTLSVALGILLLSSGLCAALGLDTILCAMTIGFLITNFAPKSASLFKTVERFTPPVYVLFFVLVGANMDVWSMKASLIAIAITYVICRTTGKSIGSAFGARITHAPENVRKYMKFCLLSQAGVAIALSLQAFTLFQDTIGSQILMTVTMTTFIVTLVGPIFVKYGITKAGEAGMDITEEDIRRKTRVEDLVWGTQKCVSPAGESASVVRDTTTIKDILAIFETHHNQTFAVSGMDGKLTGIITLEHLKESLAIGEMAEQLLAMDIMDKPSHVCVKDAMLSEVCAIMEENGEEAMPVIDENNTPLGMVERFAIDHYIHSRIIEMRRRLADMGGM